jgi:glucosyl-3-phosphoglycerate synthase
LIQPLSGEYAGRKSILESVPFFTGYGVETGLLIDIYKSRGLWALAQTDLEVRVHHNQDLGSLSKMSFGILQAIFRRLESDGMITMKTEPGTIYNVIKQEADGYVAEQLQINVVERPPMKSIAG